MAARLNSPRLSGRARRSLSPAELWAREAAAAKRRDLEDRLAWQIKVCQLPVPDREYQFHPIRKWRFDFAWPEYMVAAEVEGVTAQGGRHQRLAGFQDDADKYLEAQRLGWTVLRFAARQLRQGAGLVVEEMLRRAAWNRKVE